MLNDSSGFPSPQTAPCTAATPQQASAVEKFSFAVTRLAALFHDTGKANLGYQEKLKAGQGAEAIRHDLMSFLVHAESLWTPGVTDESWLSALAENPALACSCVLRGQLLPASSKWLERVGKALTSDRGILICKEELETLGATAPGLMSVLWLVLTHHRLPQGDDSAEQIDASRHLNKPRPDDSHRAHTVASVTECLTQAPGVPPWEDAPWLEAVATAARHALAALGAMRNIGVPLPPFFWVQLAAHHLRPALVLSDHLGSKQSQKTLRKTDAAAKPHIFANTINDRFYGDTLATHELKVSQLAQAVLALPSAKMLTTELGEGSLAHGGVGNPTFEWQRDLETRCSEARTSGPVFVSIVAETGSGKTLAAVRAANALSAGALRLTFALGLRSLTWQSAQAMLNEARIPECDIVVAVGQPETLGLAEVARSHQDEALTDADRTALERRGERFGSESSEGSSISAELSTKIAAASWTQALCTPGEAQALWDARTLSLLTAPIVACTSDHLVAAVSLLKGGDAKLFLRLATADLILDEIDNYSAEDLQSIAKLAFLAGSYGRNVVLMSATMSPDVKAGLYRSWQQGVALHCALRATPLSFSAVFAASNEPALVLNTPTPAQAQESWEAYVSRVAAAYAKAAQSKQLRRVRTIKLTGTTIDDAYPQLLGAAQTLHESNFTVDPATGARVSIGFVRLNTAKAAWKFAQYLSRQELGDTGPVVKFVSYHSKFPRSYLGVLDAILQTMATRKDDAPLAFLETPALRRVLNQHPTRDVIVIVCTTTLIETGRDFDFDWCILEPRSARGEVQAIGRVRRHRRQSSTPCVNVLLLDRPLKALERSTRPLWGMPGVEDALPTLRVTYALPLVFAGREMGATLVPAVGTTPFVRKRAVLRSIVTAAPTNVALAVDALPVAQWRGAFDAQLCLLPARVYAVNRIGFLEQAVQEMHLGARDSWNARTGLPPSVGFYLNSWAPFNAVHALRTPFRGERESTLIFKPSDTAVQYWDATSEVFRPARRAVLQSAIARNALVPDLAQQADQLPGDTPHVRGCSLRCAPGDGATKELTWHPALGFLEGTF
jgi:CRISPR-associated endonuclease/helicase Cas3